MKKLGVIVLLSLLLASSFVSAQSNFGQSVESLLGDLTSAIYPVAKYLLGNADSPTPELLFVKVLVFLLVMVFAAAAAKKIPLLQDSSGSAFIVAAVIAILGVRFITTPELIDLIWLPTSTFAVALTSIIPFAIFFFVIEGFDSRVLRKFGWTTYLVIFLYFAIDRYNDPVFQSRGITNAGIWVYLIIAAVSAALIFGDKKIHGWFRFRNFEAITDRSKRIQAVELADQIDNLYATLAKARTTEHRNDIEEDIKEREATLKRFFS